MKSREFRRHTSERSEIGARVMVRIAFGSAVFCMALSAMMIINHLQLKTSDPLNSPVIAELKQSLESNPKDLELKQEIRSLDLLARKAVFTSQHMLRMGGYLLLAGIFLLVASLRVLQELNRRFPYVGRDEPAKDKYDKAEKSGIIIGGVILVLVSLTIAFIPGFEEKVEQPESAAAPKVQEKISDTWPCFRGPMGQGISYSKSAPTSWNGKENKNIIWKTELPKRGDNSPVVWKDKIFLSSATETEITILCINKADGVVLWQKTRSDIPEASTPLPEVMDEVGHVASTMATDENGLFAIFSSGDVVCLDFDGKPKWIRKLGPIDNPYGHSSSLITWQGKLFIQIDQEDEKGNVYALNCKTGKTIWEADRVIIQPSWATPIIVSTDKRTELIVLGEPNLTSYDPAKGNKLWELKYVERDPEVAPSLAYEDGIIFLSNEYVATMGIDIQTTPGQPVKLWEQDDDLPDVASPLAVNGLLFVGASYGMLSCYDSKTGERYWQHEFDEEFCSSPVHVGGNVYIAGKDGLTHVIAASKEYKLIESSVLGEKILATPVITGGRLYLRGEKHLYCIGTE